MNHFNVYLQYTEIPPPFKAMGKYLPSHSLLHSSLVERSSHLYSNLAHRIISPMHLFITLFLQSPNPQLNSATITKELTRQFNPCYSNSLPTNLSSCSYIAHQKLWKTWKTSSPLPPSHYADAPSFSIPELFLEQFSISLIESK